MTDENTNSKAGGVARSVANIPPTSGFMPESLIRIIWRSRGIVLLTTFVSLAAAAVYVTTITPVYTSTSKIFVEQSGPKIITETERGVLTQSKNYLYNQAALLKSTPILTAVLNDHNAMQMRTFAGAGNPIGILRSGLDVSVGKRDDIISVSFSSPYPDEAAEIVNAAVDSYKAHYVSLKGNTSAEVLKIIQSEKTKRTQELSEKLKMMTDFKKANEALALEGERGNVVTERLAKFSSALTEAQLATIEARHTYESMRAMVGDPAKVSQFIEAQRTTGSYGSIDSEKAELETRLEQLQQRLSDRLRQVTADHPAITVLEAEILRIKSKMAEQDTKFAQNQLAVAEQQYLNAREKENEIAKYYDEQRQQALSLNEQVAEYTMLQSDWEQTKKLCDILNERIKELDVTEEAGALNISVLELARPANASSESQKTRYMATALLVGLMLGGGLALARDWMDQTLRSGDEISALLRMPVLGAVPAMLGERSGRARGQKVHLDPDSPAAEAYKTIRTAIFLGVPNGKAKTILVTSPESAEGKTTMVSNLAISMAQAGEKTLILDADFRNPVQHLVFDVDVFEVNGSKGLASLLSRRATLEDIAEKTDIKDLDLLPCGEQLINASEVLNSKSFATLLKDLAKKYDRIVIDSPPVVHVADAQILAATSDVTLLVLRADKSTREASRRACASLSSVGAHVLGVVVNNVSKKNRYGYYGGYKV